ncbi:AAA family ATPase [Candidatus Odyssella thessalonicensis]|uniref:AAA family ATPase n=1 Tax=Candidatus Odyssella thessalonicensis TaxID=84647 RepID=UPI000225B77A|nr:AAA family ATPase [Candidatus Odyssella thessalonicensis]
MIILIGGEKGGPGKTTIATNIAAIRTSIVGDVLLVDTDKQPTSSYWCSLREDKGIAPRVSSIQKYDKAVRTEIVELSKKYSDIIIDAGGRDSPELRGALLVCDKAIFPLRPSQFDLWTLGRLNTLVETAKEINEKLQAYVVINQSSPNPAVKEAEEMKGFLTEFENIKALNSVICERIAFRRAALNGMAVTEYKPEDIKANEEIMGLYKEIYE